MLMVRTSNSALVSYSDHLGNEDGAGRDTAGGDVADSRS